MVTAFCGALAVLTASVSVNPSVSHPGRSSPTLGAATDTNQVYPAPAPELAWRNAALGTWHYVMLRRVVGDSEYRAFGRLAVQRTMERRGALTVLTNVAHYDWPGGRTTIDTTTSVNGTFAPISERTRTPGEIISYDFDHLHSTGRIGPSGALKVIDDSLPRPAFNSTDVDMLMTVLPLDRHFHTRLPLYDPEYPGFRVATIAVRGREWCATAHGKRQAWVVSLDQPSGHALSYWVDVDTHLMLQKEFHDPAGPAYRVVMTGDTPT